MFPFVNTDLNCSLSILALSLLSRYNVPPFFNPDTPILSFLLDFTYDQNGLVFPLSKEVSKTFFIIIIIQFNVPFKIISAHMRRANQ